MASKKNEAACTEKDCESIAANIGIKAAGLAVLISLGITLVVAIIVTYISWSEWTPECTEHRTIGYECQCFQMYNFTEINPRPVKYNFTEINPRPVTDLVRMPIDITSVECSEPELFPGIDYHDSRITVLKTVEYQCAPIKICSHEVLGRNV